ncbi:L-erythrulose kinase [Streptomyces viridiviolaceus]|uniref:Dihydroxyacetone kinase family protein n=1 Tax=Streptomyces viridiviolaceus TaxID=68282 RepID=A0ABW2EGM3_9ACTN|nr:dihydroxyacetone kinase family protein [Streptomyces viridiviolaceus]GHB48488.1 L-erythrulose kinase [Streptomyces viridiviolaceus]
MTLLVNDPRAFADEALAGFAAAHPDEVRALHGGVVRASATPPGQVAVVLGGGTGHYPAFAGWVGPGFAHGAACGNIFASPSASQICSVARAAENGGGVVFGFGNYAGDVLHFGQAAEQLRAEGIDVRVLAVTDDIASAPAGRPDMRRGIGGDLPVLKMLCAAAEEGRPLDEVERAGRRANAATRSLGLAFDGCTLPGSDRPLFTVAGGHMGVGLGIHGEPGIEERPLPTGDEVADLLVDRVLAERADAAGAVGGSDRIALLLNGLGATKYEELYVVHRRVAERLAAEGLTVVAPVVGEQVTSLGMAGLSLSVTFLDADLETLWRAPAVTPAFRRGHLARRPDRTDDLTAAGRVPAVVPADAGSRALGTRIAEALRTVRDTVVAHEQRLGDIDAVAGDGDHGLGMRRGAEAAAAAAEEAVRLGGGARTVLARAGAAWAERGGGTSGALWGAALTAFGSVLGDSGATDGARLAAGVRAAVDAVRRLGGAGPGDKTLVDAALPFADRLEEVLGDNGFAAAWADAARVAERAAQATSTIPARRGRARTHGDRSLGTPDAGAVSLALILTALTPYFRQENR